MSFLIFFFLFSSQLFLVSSDAEPDEDSGGGSWLEVCVCGVGVCVWVSEWILTLRVGGMMMTPYSQHCMCVWGGPDP